jgi:hypothetical protein
MRTRCAAPRPNIFNAHRQIGTFALAKSANI